MDYSPKVIVYSTKREIGWLKKKNTILEDAKYRTWSLMASITTEARPLPRRGGMWQLA
jgi:hypothetical protein